MAKLISLLPTTSVLQHIQLQKFTSNGGKLNFFQMDQAEFEDQKLSRNKRKSSDVANLGRNDSLSADCLSQISAWIQIWDDGADKPH